MKFIVKAIAILASLTLNLNASAAYIVIDDSDPNTITLTAGDFDGGLWVNQTLFTTGIGNSASQTFQDVTPIAMSARWDTHGEALVGPGPGVFIFFGPVSAPTGGVVSSGISIVEPSDYIPNPYQRLDGGFAGYDDSIGYGSTVFPTLEQNGQTGFASFPYLTVSFKSEVASSVPEAASAWFMGSGLAVILAYGRRRRDGTNSERQQLS